ncbi:indolepyruvate ferredoxin oxidoreductase subunit alpha [uncultured Sphaerochaeta sp.]|uniref:indolepyruvate ferredoxin oxidoreductase subunit alpha n=1 Tax=uncultured Sphaerochaeta sp. TaxID=886478 RepID=UPI002A0A6F42|nr:indolepyruvate ferredoxin oxidoreductase subunit alpha [uncultured Sphaerochaeta sp.]
MKQLLTGNEAVARGAWEAGVLYASGYPGTPSTEILENLIKYSGVYSEWAPNEKVALESVIGASFAGARSLATMKHVGLNVAADPLFTLAYTGVNGGLVIISADDPGLHSSQDEQDNRHYARSARVAMLEPSDSQEAKDFMKTAFALSEKYDMPILYRMTTRVCHSKSIVDISEGRTEVPLVPYEKKDKFNPVPEISKKLHSKVERNIKALEEYSNSTELNYIEWGSKKTGIIAAGAAFQYAKEVFGDNASYLKLGFTYPLPMEKIKAFAKEVDELIVVEELDPVMEIEIKAAGIKCTGKDKIPREGELNPDILREALLSTKHQTIDVSDIQTAKRPPVLCAGCPHRGFFQELGKLKDIITVSDIGCYGLAPKDIAICMGGGFSVAHGAQKVFSLSGSSKRCVGIMGDSTFFHSGMTSMLEAVYNNSSVLLVVLDNRITGMTGHQQNPGSGFNLKEEPTNLTNIAEVAKALGVKHIRVINPLDLKEVRETLQWGLSFTDPAVIITRYPCALKKYSADDKSEFGTLHSVCRVDVDKCIGCKACVKTGCPAILFDPSTKKASIDTAQCTGCTVCAQVCPKNAIVKEER